MRPNLDRLYRQHIHIDYSERWPTQETIIEPIHASGAGSLPLTLKRARTLEALTVPLQWVADGIGHLQDGITHYSAAIEEKHQRRWAESTSSFYLEIPFLKRRRSKPGSSKHPYDTGVDVTSSMETPPKVRHKGTPETQTGLGNSDPVPKISQDQHVDETRERSPVYEIWESRSGPLASYGVAPVPKKKVRFRDRVRASLPASASGHSKVKSKRRAPDHDLQAPLLIPGHDPGENSEGSDSRRREPNHSSSEEESHGDGRSEDRHVNNPRNSWKCAKDRRASTYPTTLADNESPPVKEGAVSQQPSKKRKVDFQTPESKRHQPDEALARRNAQGTSKTEPDLPGEMERQQNGVAAHGPNPKSTPNHEIPATDAQKEKTETERGRIQSHIHQLLARLARRPFTSKSSETIVRSPQSRTQSSPAHERYGLDGHGNDGNDRVRYRTGPPSWVLLSKSRRSAGPSTTSGSSRFRDRTPAPCPMCSHTVNLPASPSASEQRREGSPGYPYLIF